MQKLNRATQRSTEIIKSRAYTVSGILDGIDNRDDKFLLRIDSQKSLLVHVDPEKVRFERLGSLCGKPTTVEGIVHFRANGEPKFIYARRIGVKSSKHDLFKRQPTGAIDDSERLNKAANFKLSTLWGKWPGNETFEELIEILESMRNSGENK